MTNHSVAIAMSPRQAEYVCELIEADLDAGGLDDREHVTATAALRKVATPLGWVQERIKLHKAEGRNCCRDRS